MAKIRNSKFIADGVITDSKLNNSDSFKRLLATQPELAAKIKKAVFKGVLGEDNFSSGIIVGSYLYLTTDTIPVQLIKIDLTTFQKVGKWVANESDDENWGKKLVSVGSYLYLALSYTTTPDAIGKIVKIDPSTMTKVSTLKLNTGEENLFDLITDGTYLYAIIDVAPGKVAKIDPATMTEITTLTLGIGEDNSLFGIYVGGYIYVSVIASGPGLIAKIDPATMTEITTLTLGVNEFEPSVMASDGTDLFVASANYNLGGNIIIGKINLGTFTETSIIDLSNAAASTNDMNLYSGYLYIGSSTLDYSQGIVTKVNATTMVEDSTLTIAEGSAVTTVSDGTYIYTALSNNFVIKINQAAMTRISTLTLLQGDLSSQAISTDGSYIYVACISSMATLSKLLKIDKNTLTIVATMNFTSSDDPRYMIYANGYLYASSNTTPGRIIKINPTTMTIVTTLILNTGHNGSFGMVYDGTYIYVCCYITPGIIVKINPITMTEVGSLTLASGERPRLIGFDGNYIYPVLYRVPTRIIKVDSSTMTRITDLTLNAGENYCRGFVFDGTYFYATSMSTPNYLVKVDPSTMTRVTALNITDGGAIGATYDGIYLYVGSSNNSFLLKIDPNTMTKVSKLTLSWKENNLFNLFTDGLYIYGQSYAYPTRFIKKIMRDVDETEL